MVYWETRRGTQAAQGRGLQNLHSWVRIPPAPPSLPRCRRFCYDSDCPGRSGASMTRPVCFALSMLLACSNAASAPRTAEPAQPKSSPVLVIGFVGGFVKHDNAAHSEVQLAARLRQDYPSGVQVAVFENRRREKAHDQILQALDMDKNGALSPEEKQQARIIIYGHSWGASETVALARELETEELPVLLTIQVDSISKSNENDMMIPANVSQAANFYQPHGIFRGRPEIRPADAARTQIIGNFRFDYKVLPVSCPLYPWFDRFFMKSHGEIECDPRVWNQIESLIRAKLPSPLGSAAAK